MLVANPVKTCKDQDENQNPRLNKKGEVKTCRIPLLKEEQQREWLQRKLLGAATLQALTLRPNLPLYFRKKGETPGKIVTVTFEGVLLVNEPNQMQSLMVTGIGPAKGFGCGLLSVARA
jgi:CRISPR system Cascade subunit CasE